MKDHELVKYIKSGDKEKAIAELYKTYFPLVRKIIFSRGGNKEDAKDIFQEAVLKLYLRVMEGKLREEGANLGGFIIHVSQNCWIDKVRKDKRLTFTEEFHDLPSMYSNSDSSLLLFIKSEKNKMIDEVLSSIGEKCQELLRQVIFFNLSMKEIAVNLGFKNEESAKTQHYKCKQKLIAAYRDNQFLKEVLRSESYE
ncbi:MAG TPA: sigma-70 family RNA polymerase sigma factor [Cytophagaceae bacterium]